VSQALTKAFEEFKARFKPGVIQQPTTFYFSLGDEEGQKWILKLAPESCEIDPGKTTNADVVLKTSEELFLKLITGKWTPGVMDFMRGKIKTNDPEKLTLLKDCFT
jgi:long-chain acyl-CoA synthetase